MKFNRLLSCVFAVLGASLMYATKDEGGGGIEGTSIAHSNPDVFDAQGGMNGVVSGSGDPIAKFCPEIAGSSNPAAGSSGGQPEINGNYTFGAHKITPNGGGSSGSGDQS